MTWQEAVRLDPEAREDFRSHVSRCMADCDSEIARGVVEGNLGKAAAAVGKKQAWTDLLQAFEVEWREAEAYAGYRREAGLDH